MREGREDHEMKNTNQMDMFAVSEPAEVYDFPGKGVVDSSVQRKLEEDAVIEQALRIMEKRFYGRYVSYETIFSRPSIVHDYLTVRYAALPYEVFSVCWLDTVNRLIEHEELFRGTVDSASVYPREVARRALELSASGVILVHNHPSGSTEPSDGDRRITRMIQEALGLLDVKVRDHIIVAGTETVSFAERGFI